MGIYASMSVCECTTGHTEKIYSVHFHPLASGVLASTSYDMTVRIWDVDSGEDHIVLQGHIDTVSILLLTVYFLVIIC